jgi:hypothetical protein
LEVNDSEACDCSDIKRTWDFSTFIVPVYADKLLSIEAQPRDMLSSYLIASYSSKRRCERCSQRYNRTFNVKPQATVVMLQINFDKSNSAQTLSIFEALAVRLPFISPEVRLSANGFPNADDGLVPFQRSFVLKGFISYGGGHYVTYFRHKQDGAWYHYDDISARQAGTLFDVVSATLKCRGLPVLVVFEASDMPVEEFSPRELEILRKETQRLDRSAAFHAEQPMFQGISIFSNPYPSPKQDVQLINLVPVQYSPPKPLSPLQSEEASLAAVEPERSPFQQQIQTPPKRDLLAHPANSMHNKPKPVQAGSWLCEVCLTKYTKETLTCSKHRGNDRLTPL